MLLEHEKIKSESEFNALCAVMNKDFERICEYIREKIFLKDITSSLSTSSDRDTLVHKYNNLDEVIQMVTNRAVSTVPEINI